MKVGEFARHARASRLSKKAKFEAAFERAGGSAFARRSFTTIAVTNHWFRAQA